MGKAYVSYTRVIQKSYLRHNLKDKKKKSGALTQERWEECHVLKSSMSKSTRQSLCFVDNPTCWDSGTGGKLRPQVLVAPENRCYL